MKTAVIMKRELFGMEINQNSKTEFFSATDLVKAGNKWRSERSIELFNLNEWLRLKGTKEFIAELEKKYGKIKSPARNKIHHTWVHPLLFIDIALAISPKLKIEVYEWLFDHLIKTRNESGDTYKIMCGVLYSRHSNKRTFDQNIKKLALMIKQRCKVDNWQDATKEQLTMRDKIHQDIAWLAESLDSNQQAIRMALDRNG